MDAKPVDRAITVLQRITQLISSIGFTQYRGGAAPDSVIAAGEAVIGGKTCGVILDLNQKSEARILAIVPWENMKVESIHVDFERMEAEGVKAEEEMRQVADSVEEADI